VYDGRGDNRDQLVSCYTSALAVADGLAGEHGVDGFTLALPLVSAGVYGWPVDDAVRVQVETLRGTPTRVSRCVLVAFSDQAHRLLAQAVAS
jgi:O-acetyl-ADP-ribose deacetylase (regulator of RNase III)